MKKDLLECDEVRTAIRDNRLHMLSGAAKSSLCKRGLAQWTFSGRPPAVACVLTPEGESLRAQLINEHNAEIRAAREAEGVVTVPRWALRSFVESRYRDMTSEWEQALATALRVSEKSMTVQEAVRAQRGASFLSWIRPVSWRGSGKALEPRAPLPDAWLLVPSSRGGDPVMMLSTDDLLGDWEVVSCDIVNEEVSR